MGIKLLKYIAIGKLRHNDFYDYSKTEEINGIGDHVTITCPKHGDFKQKVSGHFLRGTGCQACANENRGGRISKDEYVKQAILIHGNTYDYSLVKDIRASKEVIEIICRKHGVFNQSVHTHVHGKSGCPSCGKVGRTRITVDDFIKRSTILHENKYDYSRVNKINGIYDIVDIICPQHGKFTQCVNNHMNVGSGCPTCGNIKKMAKIAISKTHDDFISESKIVHNEKYDYSLTKYIKNDKKVKIICREHGAFLQRASGHLRGAGCAKCALKNRTYTPHEFYEQCNVMHENKYDYSKCDYVSGGGTKKIKILCPKHGEFSQKASEHLHGSGCHSCWASKGELGIKDFLDKNSIVYESEKKFDTCVNKRELPFDFYLPQHNVCIEYDGVQHSTAIVYWGGDERLKQTQDNDAIKTKWCVDNGVDLIRIDYTEKEQIKNILSTHLLGK